MSRESEKTTFYELAFDCCHSYLNKKRKEVGTTLGLGGPSAVMLGLDSLLNKTQHPSHILLWLYRFKEQETPTTRIKLNILRLQYWELAGHAKPNDANTLIEILLAGGTLSEETIQRLTTYPFFATLHATAPEFFSRVASPLMAQLPPKATTPTDTIHRLLLGLQAHPEQIEDAAALVSLFGKDEKLLQHTLKLLTIDPRATPTDLRSLCQNIHDSSITPANIASLATLARHCLQAGHYKNVLEQFRPLNQLVELFDRMPNERGRSLLAHGLIHFIPGAIMPSVLMQTLLTILKKRGLYDPDRQGYYCQVACQQPSFFLWLIHRSQEPSIAIPHTPEYCERLIALCSAFCVGMDSEKIMTFLDTYPDILQALLTRPPQQYRIITTACGLSKSYHWPESNAYGHQISEDYPHFTQTLNAINTYYRISDDRDTQQLIVTIIQRNIDKTLSLPATNLLGIARKNLDLATFFLEEYPIIMKEKLNNIILKTVPQHLQAATYTRTNCLSGNFVLSLLNHQTEGNKAMLARAIIIATTNAIRYEPVYSPSPPPTGITFSKPYIMACNLPPVGLEICYMHAVIAMEGLLEKVDTKYNDILHAIADYQPILARFQPLTEITWDDFFIATTEMTTADEIVRAAIIQHSKLLLPNELIVLDDDFDFKGTLSLLSLNKPDKMPVIIKLLHFIKRTMSAYRDTISIEFLTHQSEKTFNTLQEILNGLEHNALKRTLLFSTHDPYPIDLEFYTADVISALNGLCALFPDNTALINSLTPNTITHYAKQVMQAYKMLSSAEDKTFQQAMLTQILPWGKVLIPEQYIEPLYALYNALAPLPKLQRHLTGKQTLKQLSRCRDVLYLSKIQTIVDNMKEAGWDLKSSAHVIYTLIKQNVFRNTQSHASNLSHLLPSIIDPGDLAFYLTNPHITGRLARLVKALHDHNHFNTSGCKNQLKQALKGAHNNKTLEPLLHTLSNTFDAATVPDDRTRSFLIKCVLDAPMVCAQSIVTLHGILSATHRRCFLYLYARGANESFAQWLAKLTEHIQKPRQGDTPKTILTHENIDLLMTYPEHLNVLYPCLIQLYNATDITDAQRRLILTKLSLPAYTHTVFLHRVKALITLLRTKQPGGVINTILGDNSLAWPITVCAFYRTTLSSSTTMGVALAEATSSLTQHADYTEHALKGMLKYPTPKACLADLTVDNISCDSLHPLHQFYTHYHAHSQQALFKQWIQAQCTQVMVQATELITQSELTDLIATQFGLVSHMPSITNSPNMKISAISPDLLENRPVIIAPSLALSKQLAYRYEMEDRLESFKPTWEGFDSPTREYQYTWQTQAMCEVILNDKNCRPFVFDLYKKKPTDSSRVNTLSLLKAAYHPISPKQFAIEHRLPPLLGTNPDDTISTLDHMNMPWADYLLGLYYMGELPTTNQYTAGPFESMIHDDIAKKYKEKELAFLKDEETCSKALLDAWLVIKKSDTDKTIGDDAIARARAYIQSDEERIDTIREKLKEEVEALSDENCAALTLAEKYFIRVINSDQPNAFHQDRATDYLKIVRALMPIKMRSPAMITGANSVRLFAPTASSKPTTISITSAASATAAPMGGAGGS